jgi:hypothetical protein
MRFYSDLIKTKIMSTPIFWSLVHRSFLMAIFAIQLGSVASQAQDLTYSIQGREYRFLMGPENHVLALDIQKNQLIDLAGNVGWSPQPMVPEVVVHNGIAHVFYLGTDQAVWMAKFPSTKGPVSLGERTWNYPKPMAIVFEDEIYLFTRRFDRNGHTTVIYRTLQSGWKEIAYGVGQIFSVKRSSQSDDILIEVSASQDWTGQRRWISFNQHRQWLGLHPNMKQ